MEEVRPTGLVGDRSPVEAFRVGSWRHFNRSRTQFRKDPWSQRTGDREDVPVYYLVDNIPRDRPSHLSHLPFLY